MNNSNKESFTYNLQSNQFPQFGEWLKELQKLSKKYQRYGSFLPTQLQLLRQLHNALTQSPSRVISLTAPPASGKTHIIALCASYLINHNASTCIVTPNNELKIEFQYELNEFTKKSSKPLPVINLSTYMRRRNDFQYAFIDESHNLRSAIELDRNIVMSIHLEKGDPLYDNIVLLLEKTKANTTRELDSETAHDILNIIRETSHGRDVQRIIRTLSQWRSFCIVTDTTCDLKFLAANPKKRSLMPKGKLLLFSATLLNPEELQFYCSIPETLLQPIEKKEPHFIPNTNVSYCFIQCKSDNDKKRLVRSLLIETDLLTLVLLNNNRTCLNWSNNFPKLANRVITIQSGLRYRERLKLYRKFISRSDQILMTSSNVFWEGITIKGLKVLIIPYPPYPQPSLLEIAQGKHTQYSKIAKRRLIQGIGRIGRSLSEDGVCILLFRPDDLLNYFKKVTMKQINPFIKNLK